MTLDRFTGRKHALLFTRRELRDIQRGATPVDLSIKDALVYSYGGFPPAFVLEDVFLPFLQAALAGLPLKPSDIDLVVTSNCHFAFNSGRSPTLLRTLFPNADIERNIEHHTIHQWQAYLPSGFDAAAVLTADESGERLNRLRGRKLALTLSLAETGRITVLAEHEHPTSSPGLMYADFSRHLGYRAGEEGKTMGLAPYGGDHVYRQLAPELKLRLDGSFAFLPSDQLALRLSRIQPRRASRDPVTPIHADIAYAGQRLLEDILVNAAHVLRRRSPASVRDLCVAGGVGLNSCANERMFRAAGFERLYVCPNAGDDGHALACALYGARVVRGRPLGGLSSDYLGPPLGDGALRAELERQRDRLEARGCTLGDADADAVASLLAQGGVVGLIQGGSEFGPRALGNRSILADPRHADTTVRINESVKHRELFRPYAPVVLEERVEEWFDHRGPSAYMMRVVPVRSEKRHELGAITHIDGTARLQTVSRQQNPRLYGLVEAFERLTGVPVLLNTSFNLAGKPIVESLQDALQCFEATDLDALVAGPCLLKKTPQREGRTKTTREALDSRAEYEHLRDSALGHQGWASPA